MNDPLRPERLAGIVGDLLDLDPGAMRLIPLRTGKFNRSFRVETGDRTVLLRIAPPDDVGQLFYERRMMRQEPSLHALLRRRTRVPVPEVLAFDASRRRLDRDLILLEWLPGTALSERSDAGRWESEVFRRIGEMLAEVHAIRRSEHGYVGEHRPMEPQSTWADAFRVMWNLLLDDVEATGVMDPAEIGLFRRALDERIDLFDRDRPASLLHMDVWHQNILVDDGGRVTGLVDWDRALWGDPEIEFAVLDYCGVSVPSFWEGYGRARDDSPEARERWLFYYLYELLKYIPIRVWRGGGPAGARRYADTARRMARSWGR